MHPFSILTLAIFVAGYITARWDLVTRFYELAIFAWVNGVIYRIALGCAFLSVAFLFLFIPVQHIARHEVELHPRSPSRGISAREQLRRRGSF
ncbi:putative phosphatidylinositol class Q [Rosellinia necatrix]|uniref:Putative phosphatidylinositol class Q n=1 Tax=Rosellinia necatrix TaxID=77044 RepID=A0A1S8A8T6_ROSNE|nr:putative phosphatidylinositol class Q [Rosellinia necatrix]